MPPVLGLAVLHVPGSHAAALLRETARRGLADSRGAPVTITTLSCNPVSIIWSRVILERKPVHNGGRVMVNNAHRLIQMLRVAGVARLFSTSGRCSEVAQAAAMCRLPGPAEVDDG